MATNNRHFWHYEYLDSKSIWLFVTPSDFAKSIGLYVTELGHFFQDGNCYTNRVPESSYSINFSPSSYNHSKNPIQFQFPTQTYSVSPSSAQSGIVLIDNHQGYQINQNGAFESYFIQCAGFLAEKYFSLILNQAVFHPVNIGWMPAMIDSFEKLVLLYRQPSNEKRDAYASMLLLKILSQLIVEKDNSQPLYVENKYVKRTINIIENHFSEPLKLSDIAEELHINSSYLSRLFKIEAGVSFSSCLTHVRINQAKEMLRTTELSIEAIAICCGFCNSSHFIKLFHSHEKMTPMQYRRVWQEK